MSFAELAGPFARLARSGEDLAFEIHLQQLSRKTIHHVNILRTDIDAARQAGILELFDEFPIGVEDLNSLILAVRHPELTFGIDRQSVRDVKFARLLSFPAPRFDELSILVAL